MNELLYPFTQLPPAYVILDLETTGLPDDQGAPGIVTIGMIHVLDHSIQSVEEIKVRPDRKISKEAYGVHGISNTLAKVFPSLKSSWEIVYRYLLSELVVCHNAVFDWPILCEVADRSGLEMPPVRGVFCTQRSAQPWAMTQDMYCSQRGPSLDNMTKALGLTDLRKAKDGIHGSSDDCIQTFNMIQALRALA